MVRKAPKKELGNARNPLLPSALTAIQRAALKARQLARDTQTAIVIEQDGRIERIEANMIQEPGQPYSAKEWQPNKDSDK